MSEDRASFLRKWVYYLGIFPNFNNKTKQMIPNRIRALLLTVVYFLSGIATIFVFATKSELYQSGIFKLLSDITMQFTILNWLWSNNTHRTDNLTQICYNSFRPELILSTTQNVVSYIGHFLVTVLIIGSGVSIFYDNFNCNPSALIFQVYSLHCVHMMHYGRLMLIYGMSQAYRKLNASFASLGEVENGPLVWHISRIIGDHNAIADWVDLFNQTFGFETLVVKLYEMFNMLAFLDYLLDPDEGSGKKTLIMLLWNCNVLSQGVVIAHVCELFAREGRSTINMAFKKLHQFENHPNGALKERIYVFSQQAVQRCPRFTAWDFFDIDHKMIFMFANLVVTYVIVIIQFKAKG